MWPFKKQRKQEAVKRHLAEQEAQVTLDVIHHKKQRAEVIAETNKSVDNLNREIAKNNITIQIVVAASRKNKS